MFNDCRCGYAVFCRFKSKLGFTLAHLDDTTLETVAAFQRLIKGGTSAETDAFPLAALKRADALLGSRDHNEPYRLVLRQKISDLEAKEDRKHQSFIRIVSYIVTFALGVLTTVAAEFVLGR